MWRQKQILELCYHKPRNAKDEQQTSEARRGKERIFFRAFRGSMTLSTLSFQTSSFRAVRE